MFIKYSYKHAIVINKLFSTFEQKMFISGQNLLKFFTYVINFCSLKDIYNYFQEDEKYIYFNYGNDLLIFGGKINQKKEKSKLKVVLD